MKDASNYVAHTMFFASHASQSSLLKLLSMPFSTIPCTEVSKESFHQRIGYRRTNVEEYSRCNVDALQTSSLRRVSLRQ